jgi:putative transposase
MIHLGITARKTGELLECPVSTLYYRSVRDVKDSELALAIRNVAFTYTFYGYRRIHHAVNKLGFSVNLKKVYRIYKSLNLQKHKPRKNKKLSIATSPLTEPLYSMHVWALDFVFDRLTDGRALKFMTVEDLFSRFSPGIKVSFSIPAKQIVEFLEELFRLYGVPRIIITDQGPEFRSLDFQKFIQKHRIRHEFTEKGSPWQNGSLESFNGRFRDECLSRNLFDNLAQTKEVIEKHRIFYNTERPHSSLNGKTPAEVFRRNS